MIPNIGKELKVVHQLFYNHGIHLAVLEVMYDTFLEVEVTENFVINYEDREDPEEQTEPGFAYDELDPNMDPSLLGEFMDVVDYCPDDESTATVELTDSYNIKSVVDKVRKIIILFRKSPTKMDDIFRTRSMEVYGKEYTLNLDTKTRWNSTYDMLQRFLDTQKCISLSLIDLNSELSVTTAEWKLISTICKAIKAVLLATKMLCRRETNLLAADTVLSSLLKSIPVGTPFTDRLFSVLSRRINERRGISSIALQYLHNRGTHSLHPTLSAVEYIDKEVLAKFLFGIWSRSKYFILNPEEDIEIIYCGEEEQEHIEPDFEAIYNKESMLLRQQGNLNIKTANIKDNSFESVEREMQFFESNGVKGTILEYCYNSLMGLPPTSVEAERNFSVAGNIVTKLRTRISDNSLKDITMLKSYFQQRKEKACNK